MISTKPYYSSLQRRQCQRRMYQSRVLTGFPQPYAHFRGCRTSKDRYVRDNEQTRDCILAQSGWLDSQAIARPDNALRDRCISQTPNRSALCGGLPHTIYPLTQTNTEPAKSLSEHSGTNPSSGSAEYFLALPFQHSQSRSYMGFKFRKEFAIFG